MLVTTNEQLLDATYKVRYFGGPPHFLVHDDNLPKMNYTEAIDIATRWLKEERDTNIYDGSIIILRIYHRGVEFVTYDPNHTHYEEHIKIKIALDKVWGEIWSKRLQL